MWRREAFFMFCFSFIVGIQCKNSIRIEANGYRGILVAISPAVDRIYGGELLLKLKNVFSKASERLFNITKRRAFFREVIFLIPHSWGSEQYWLPEKETADTAKDEKYKDAVIYVENGGTFGKEPYTVQTSGCQKNGLRIHIPEEFLRSMDLEEQANKLVFEWSKYRYGIFNEHGFANDERYPLFYGTPGDSKVRVTSCLNQEAEIKNDSCLPKVDYNTGKLVSNCQLEIEPINDRISSSFMYAPQLREFCGTNDNLHDSRSPTKHNVLCKEKSIWDVILQHEDFKDGLNNPSGIEGITRSTTFKFVQLSDIPLRMVLAIDRSKVVTDERADIMNRAARRFFKFIPQDSLVGSVSFGGSSEKNFSKELQPVKYATLKRQQSGIELPCFKCAFIESANLLEKKNNSEGGIIYLLTTSEINSEEVADLQDVINKKITVHIIKLYFNNYPTPKRQLEIISNTGGSIQEIPENPKITLEEKIIQLYLALCRTIRDDNFELGDNKILIFQDLIRKFPININFPVDSFIGKEQLTLLYSTSDPFKIDEKTVRLSIDDTVYEMENFENTVDEKGRKLIIPTDKIGEYRFRLENKPGYSDPVFLSVFANTTSLFKALTVRCWLNTDNQMVDPSVSPVIIYAEVSIGNQPVINAKVQAILTHPDSSKTSFFLIDDGIGDPDITKDDGIYSRYIAEFKTTGYYSLTLLVQDDKNTQYLLGSDGRCCGSFVPAKSLTPTGSFRRIYDYGNFYVLNISENNIYPPSRILDLTIVNVNPQFEDFNISEWRIYFEFRFTSVGEDYNIGSASTYEMKYFFYRNEVQDFQKRGFSLSDWDYHPKLRILEYGMPQTLKIEISLLKLMDPHQREIRIFFAMRAADEQGNYGEVSNIVEALLQIPDPPTTTTVPSTENLEEDKIKSKEQKDSVNKAGVGLSTLQTGMIIGIVVGIFVIIVIIILVLFLKRRKTKSSKVERKFEKRDIIKKPSVQYVDDVTKNSSDLTLNNLSPIQSWPANVLMNHYDKVQEAKQKNMTTPIMKVQDLLESSSVSSTKSLKSNENYDGEYEESDRYVKHFPTAPLSSSSSSLSQTPRHITQV